MDSIHRENFLKELAAGFDSYNELVKNLQEGIKFYKNLTQVCIGLIKLFVDFHFSQPYKIDDVYCQNQKHENVIG